MSYTEDRSTFNAGGATVRSTVETFLTSIEEHSWLNAFLHVNTDGVRSASEDSDERFTAGLTRPLEGLVVAVKDNICVTVSR